MHISQNAYTFLYSINVELLILVNLKTKKHFSLFTMQRQTHARTTPPGAFWEHSTLSVSLDVHKKPSTVGCALRLPHATHPHTKYAFKPTVSSSLQLRYTFIVVVGFNTRATHWPMSANCGRNTAATVLKTCTNVLSIQAQDHKHVR